MNSWIARFVLPLAIVPLFLAGCGAALQPMQSESMSRASIEEAAWDEADERASLAYSGDTSLNSAVERKVIGRASLGLVVADTDEAVAAIETIVADAGGFVANANFYKSGPSTGRALAGTMTLRVPAEGLDQLLTELEDLALSVESRSVSREDVTDQYIDVAARLTNLEATEKELLALLSEVRERPGSTAEEILQVHARMSEIRGEIESVQGRKNLLDNLIGLATIEVNLTPDALNRPIVEAGWQPTGVARAALRGLVSALQWLGSAAIWLLIFFLPLALVATVPLAVLVYLLRWIIRRTRQGKETAKGDK